MNDYPMKFHLISACLMLFLWGCQENKENSESNKLNVATGQVGDQITKHAQSQLGAQLTGSDV
jgi:hypothetical protein